MKTGECYYRDDMDNLCLAESFQDADGVVSTIVTIVEYAVQPE